MFTPDAGYSICTWLTLFSDRFPHLDEDDQCRLIDIISRMPCAADGSLQLRRAEPPYFNCTFCSNAEPVSLSSASHEEAKAASVTIFSKIIKIPSFLESRRPRVCAMVALRRLTRHSTCGEFWDLETSGPGRWCIQSLHSSIRELRIAAGRALAVFVSEPQTPGFDAEILRRNRANAMSILKSLSDKGAANLHETCIMAWAQVGKVVSEDELNLTIIKLVEYLGHRSMIVSGLAFNELLNLADSRGESPEQLFMPFWHTLAFTVVKDLVSKPQTARLVADLLQIGVPDLLLMLQIHALPWLVLTKKREVIQKITEARRETDPFVTCMDTPNLPSIMALLLVQDVPDIASHTMSLLAHVSDRFAGLELVELLQAEPLYIAMELLRTSADANEARKVKVGSRRNRCDNCWKLTAT